MKSNQLYFIALFTPAALTQKIQKLKQEIKQKFNSSHSLNAPPHITLLSPFKHDEESLSNLDALLQKFSSSFQPFEIRLNDFSTFPPRVIFIDVEKTPKLMLIQKELESLARKHPAVFTYNYDKRPFHPHLTLAFKDLTKNNFYAAWREFEDRSFKETFQATALYLLKHNGKKWIPVKSYPFG